MVNVIVVFPNLENAKSVRNLLIRNGYSVAGVCTSGAQALQAADRLTDGIIVCGYKFRICFIRSCMSVSHPPLRCCWPLRTLCWEWG